MYGIDILVKEHDNILKFIDLSRKSCREILDGKEVDIELFRKYIDFVRNYGDKHHHGKEEEILFKLMVDNLSPVAEKLINHGMLIEHDLGRLFMKNLEAALDRYEENKDNDCKLDIITNIIGYGDLLTRHIEKENKVVYTFAERELSDELKQQVDRSTEQFEKDYISNKNRYEKWLEELSLN
ncbi:hemerythrin domain-containing protein [Peptostreptococcus equinus]|uniref:Hemerythrin domain-containing protein n=1 Tax=Peptostreptococcus equinus TaxID=3003601 RepID=A0ABY7JRN7_9FIRM|nr:hemerythrin domain-containing protein [Peptostreptococcus sp. CBA3647]WAW14718.1 hemerythrin domain-containing protein [Peptostreptococcus sp. CBA3647]